MSTREGENQNPTDWPTLDNVRLLPTAIDYENIAPKEISPMGHAKLADLYRDSYLRTGNGDHHRYALIHYEEAESRSDKEPLLQAWVICSRVYMSWADFERGIVESGDIEEQLNDAYILAAKTKTIDQRGFRLDLMEWISGMRKMLEVPSDDQEPTQEFRLPVVLQLVGGTAIEAAGPSSAPEPGAA